MPTFLTSVVGFNLQRAGVIAVLPYLACFAGSIAFGWLADRLSKGGAAPAAAEEGGATLLDSALPDIDYPRIARVRAGMAVVAEVVPSVCLVAAGYVQSAPLVVALLTVALGLSGAVSGSFASTYIDLAPRNAGVLLAIGNTVATTAGVLAPIMVGQLVADQSAVEGWRMAFSICAAIAIAGAAQYCWLLSPRPLEFWGGDARGEGGEGLEEQEE